MATDRLLEDPAKLMLVLRAERLSQELSLEWVAERVGVKFQSIQEFESGKSRPSEPTLRKWLHALGLPERWADAWGDWRAVEQIGRVLAERGVDPDGQRAVMRQARLELADSRARAPDQEHAAASSSSQ